MKDGEEASFFDTLPGSNLAGMEAQANQPIWSDAALRIGGVWYRSLQGHLQTKGEWAPKEAGVGSVNVTFVGPCVPTLSMKQACGRSINVQYTCTEPGTKTVKYTENHEATLAVKFNNISMHSL